MYWIHNVFPCFFFVKFYNENQKAKLITMVQNNIPPRNIRLETFLVVLLIFLFFLQKEPIFLAGVVIVCFLLLLCRVASIPYSGWRVSKSEFLILLFFIYTFCVVLTRLFTGELNSSGSLLYLFTGGSFFLCLFSLPMFKKDELAWMFRAIQFFTFLQIPFIFYQSATFGFSRGDWCRGLFYNAHIAGYFLYFFLFYSIFIANRQESSKSSIRKIYRGLFLILILIAAYLTDSNTFMAAFFLVAVFFYLLFDKRLKVKVVGIVAASFICFYFFANFGALVYTIDRIPKVMGYLSLVEIAKENPFSLIFGVGPGQYSSRASVILAPPDLIAKPNGNFLPLTSSSDPFKKHLAHLYAPSYYEKLKNRGVTGTFYTPFSGVLSFLSEFGIFGTFLFFLSVSQYLRAVKNEYKPFVYVVVFSFIIMCLYDNWIEYPFISFAIALTLVYFASPRKVSVV